MSRTGRPNEDWFRHESGGVLLRPVCSIFKNVELAEVESAGRSHRRRPRSDALSEYTDQSS